MRLRTFSFLFGGLFALTGISTGIYLIKTTTDFRIAAEGIKQSTESIYSAEELSSSLLGHARAVRMEELTKNKDYSVVAAEQKKRVYEWTQAAIKHISTLEEGLAIDNMRLAIDEYFKTQGDAATGAAFEKAYKEVEGVVEMNRQQAAHFVEEIEGKDRIGNHLGIAVVAMIVLTFVCMLTFVRQLLYVPLSRTGQVMARYAKGGSTMRADPKGVYEIQKISTAFNDMAERLERQKNNELRFLSAVAHDLRNPLSAIRMSIDVLRNDKDEPNFNRDEIVKIIQRQAMQLDRLVGDLLDTTRIQSGHMDLKIDNNNLSEVVDEAAKLFSSASKDHNVQVDFPAEKIICPVDRHRIGQVMNNLISNAIKYSPYGGNIEVTAGIVGRRAVIAVKDEGMGIDSEESEKIFEPFRRSQKTRDTIPGVGLGLWTCRKIVEGHGGSIKVLPREPKGSIFEVSLPLN